MRLTVVPSMFCLRQCRCGSCQIVIMKRVCWMCFKFILLLAILAVVVMATPPFRNLLLYPWWPRVYRDVSTYKLITMMQREYPKDVNSLMCLTKKEPLVQRTNKMIYANMTYLTSSQVFLKQWRDDPSVETYDGLRDPKHMYFAPGMSISEAKDLLHMYLVLAENMRVAGVEFYLEGGSMIGAVRHHGFIPWDDDIDITINVNDWKQTRQALSCINGFQLKVQAGMHWEFRRAKQYWPYIDIFFYEEDDDIIWAIPPYIRKVHVFPKELVFPLAVGVFEGHSVPIPKRSREAVERVFGSSCESPIAHHKDHIEHDKRINIPCTDLSYLYNFLF